MQFPALKAIIFDLGGTLMEYTGMPGNWSDYYPAGFAAVNEIYACSASGNDIVRSAEVLRSYNPRITHSKQELSSDFLFTQALAHWTHSPSIPECIAHFFSGLGLRPHIYPDTIPSLLRLRQAGVLTAILTDLPSAMPDSLMRAHIEPILPLIDCYMSSAIAGVRKPHMHGLELIAQRLEADAVQMLMIGDEDKDRLTATSFGCEFAQIRRDGPEDRQLETLLDSMERKYRHTYYFRSKQ